MYLEFKLSANDNNIINSKKNKPDHTKFLKKYFIIFSSIVLISSTLSYFLNIHSLNLANYTYYFQIKFLEKNYFTSALTIYLFIYLLSLHIFYSKFSENDRKKFKESFMIMKKKLRYFYIIQNLIIYFLFIFLYNLILEPLYYKTNFRLSGHVLVCLYSSNIFLNLYDVIDLFEYYKISHFCLTAIRIIIYLLVLHILYSLIWTTCYFHTFWESTLSLVLGTTVLSILNYISFQIRQIK